MWNKKFDNWIPTSTKKRFAFFSFLIILLNSCYSVDEHKYLNVTFNESKLKTAYLKGYLDSVFNNKLIIPDSVNEVFFNGDKISPYKRIVYFKDNPQEWYLVAFDSSPCWIQAVYNPLLSDRAIHDTSFISSTELIRIKKRFEVEILKRAETYGKNHRVADSILYNLN